VVHLSDGTQADARAVVIATGARYRRLDLPGLASLEGTSVCYATTLEEASRHARDAVAVVGGGISAGQAALFLAAHTRHRSRPTMDRAGAGPSQVTVSDHRFLIAAQSF
jgi:thioredoxin reductase (NADPH)